MSSKAVSAEGPNGAAPGAGEAVDEEDIENVQYKIILLGDGAVGKTSIALRSAR
jgi:GTPase SAR1 family protein